MGADFGIPVPFLTPGFAIQGFPHEGLEPVQDDLNRLLRLILEQLEQWPGVALHASASDKDGDGLERIGELVPFCGAVGRCRAFRAKDNSPRLHERLVKRVERMTPQKEGGGVEGTALQQVLNVDGCGGGGTIRDEIEGLDGSLLEYVKVGNAFL